MGYIVNGKEYNTYSGKNQNIIDKLINREVYCCVTSEVEYMLSKVWDGDSDNPFDENDILSTFERVCSECGSGYGFEEVEVGDLKDEEFKTEKIHTDDDWVDGYKCPFCGECYESVEEARECCQDETVYRCCNCGEIFGSTEYDELDTQPREIYEWWIVSSWFGDKLADKGCAVIPSWGKAYWGRECTGQSISLDGCVVDIAKDMGILDGMEYEWSEN